ncbi:sensor histidine kinase [Pseudarthrobacter sp. NPDC058329]|uniref:sensor histidine kinase n=1 Tax=Pseudarthrobacter sp. NPDC058329 TaxID=3346448 RepID=UPI0036D81174
MKQQQEPGIVGPGKGGELAINGPLADRIDALHGRLGVRGRVVLAQLPLTITVCLVVAAAAVFSPATLASDMFRTALLAHTAVFAACLAVPWERLPPGASAVIAVLDCVAIGFTREAGGTAFNVLSLLLVFPVIWLSVRRHRYMLFLAVVGAVLSTVLPTAVAGSAAQAPGAMIRTIFLPLVMSAIAVTAYAVAGIVLRQRQRLLHSERELAQTLAENVRRQRLLDAVLAAVGIGVWVVDAEGRTVLTNKAMQADPALAALTGEAGDGGLFLADRSSPVLPHRSPVARAISGATISDELYWVGDPADQGQQRAYSVGAHGIRGGEGKDGGSVLTFVDVTGLISALEAKDNFVATVSHELRTPLTSILGYLELVLDEPGHEEIQAELLVVHRNAQHLLGLVNDLIAVASERMELSLEDTDLAKLLTEVVDSTIAKAAANGLELTLDVEQPMPARVDPNRIRQVFGNLLSNALKYSQEGGRITARARREGPELVCSITDSGVGMSAEELDQAFTKFFRSARSRETAIPGAGLGLPVSKTIIEAHGGSIRLDSTPGAGTTATFTIPCAD